MSSELMRRGLIKLVTSTQLKSQHLWWYGSVLLQVVWVTSTSVKVPLIQNYIERYFESNNCFKNPDDIFFCKGELLARQSQTPHWQHHSFEIKDAKLAGLQQHLSPTANIWQHGGGAKYIQGTWKTFSPKPKSLQMNKQVPHWFLDV